MYVPCKSFTTFLFATFMSVCVGSAAEVPGVTAEAITFGQTGCFSGGCKYQGIQHRLGILASFHERNRQGGVSGRQLVLDWHDDRYVPAQSVVNAELFFESGKVFAVVGSHGTPTSRLLAPVLRQAGVPLVGLVTGGNFLRNAIRYPNIVNLRASYADETQQLVNYLHNGLGARRFGIIYQDDSFGRSVLKTYQSALAALDLPIIAKSAYTRHTHAVHASVFAMGKADLDVVLLAAVTNAGISAINLARSLDQTYTFGFLSVTDIKRLSSAVDYPIHPAVVASITPDAGDDSLALVRRFHSVLKTYKDTHPAVKERIVDAWSIEGYILGRFVIDVLDRTLADSELTRKVFLEKALKSGPFIIDDWEISFATDSNAGSNYVRIIDMTNNKFKKVEAK